RVEIIEAPWADRLLRLLRIVANSGEIMVEPAGNKFVPDNRLDCRQSDRKLASAMVRDPIDGARNDFRLVDGRDGLRMSGHSGFDPGELRRIYRRQLHACQMDPTAVVNQLRAQGLGESMDGVLRGAVGGL